MKKFLFLFLFIIITINSTMADERKNQLNKLFNDLKIGNNDLSFNIEQKIWNIWSHPTNQKLTKMLAKGSDLVNNKKFEDAAEIFTKLLN